MTYVVNPQDFSAMLRTELREEVKKLAKPIHIVGLHVEGASKPTLTYASYAQKACEEVGVTFETHTLPRNEFKAQVSSFNSMPEVDGIFIFYPVFGDKQDKELQSLVHPQKDIEGMSSYWLSKLYTNDRFVDQQRQKKAILPCTPLAILKLISTTSFYRAHEALPLAGKQVSIFNRSEVVGRPLAHMMANDGAKVYSFDVDSCHAVSEGSELPVKISRMEALAGSDIIITGVPNPHFKKISKAEVSPQSLCLNFSSIKNFTDDVMEHCAVFIPRVGPMTVTMVIRNALRLRQNR